MVNVDVVVAGAGLWGCTVARTLAEAGRHVLVLEKRPVVGGNVRCETDAETGIEVHTYGSHIFHTHLDDAWAFVNRFVSFNGYQHKVLAHYRGRTYFLPLGLTLVNQFYGLDLKPSELPAFIRAEAAKGAEDNPSAAHAPRNFEEQAIAFVGRPLYEAFIRDYTRKQWGMDPRELSADIIKRLPVRANYDVNYFSDYRQGIPLTGYNSLFDRVLDHPNIVVECNRSFTLSTLRTIGLPDTTPVFYSGPLDALFDFAFGALPWRSLRFERTCLPMADFQGTSVVNYTGDDVPFTRIHEFKHYHPEDARTMAYPATVICREYPKAWQRGDEPYYAIDTPASRALRAQYAAAAARVPNLVVGGRLGAYRYYDMDQSIACALSAARAFLS